MKLKTSEKSNSEKKSTVSSLIVGDIHFKDKKEHEAEEFTKKVVEIAKKFKPTFIVLLGDILDTHETIKTLIHNIAEKLISELSNIAPLYVLIGNHDLINGQQFLTQNHIFGPFKRWKNVYIVDTPIIHNYDEKTFVFCPYVPNGRFVEALNTLILSEENWEFADCIFAHQEFKGCNMSESDTSVTGEKTGNISKKGDVWDENYPLVISGHIHKTQKVGNNVLYPGSSRQQNFGEDEDKRIWFVDWDKEDFEVENCGLIKKISVGMRPKKTVEVEISEISDKIKELNKIADRADCKLVLSGASEEYNNFRRSDAYIELESKNVIFSFEKTDESFSDTLKKVQVSQQESSVAKDRSSEKHFIVEYNEIFKEVVSKKNKNVINEYEKIFGNKLSNSTENSEETSSENSGKTSSENSEETSSENSEENQKESSSGLKPRSSSGLAGTISIEIGESSSTNDSQELDLETSE
jgi:DNA repair exonuclease SbcCD nuclease subunit